MNATTSLLDGMKVAKPCTAKWEEMTGDERMRRCAQCDLDVFDLSAMRRDEAESFVASRLGRERTCVRFLQRADGTVITKDCPVGVRAAWKRAKWAAAALLGAGFAAAAMFAPRGFNGPPQVAPLKQIYEFVQKQFGAPLPPVRVMGDVACPPPPPAPPPVPAPTRTMGEMYVPPPSPAQPSPPSTPVR